MTSPPWLAAIAKDAHVQPLAMKMLESYICPCPDGGTLGLAEVVNTMTGVSPPKICCEPPESSNCILLTTRFPLLLHRLRLIC